MRRLGDPLEAAWTRAAVRRRLFPGSPREVTIGRFTVLGPLGAGAMGTVWAAHDPELDRGVAIKVLLDVDDDRRLWKEARAMARLRHANVVAVYEVGAWEGRPFIVMERVDGPTLRRWLAERPRSVAEVLAVVRGAARGLSAAHDAGVVHRDFKPENVLVDSAGHARVVDFGLARASDEGAARPHQRGPDGATTSLGAAAGTPAYMAPEQLRGEGATPASDQFALCVAIHEALYGQRPFEGGSLQALERAVTAGVVREERRPGAPRGAIPAPVRRAIRRGLSADPKARFPSVAALADALGPKSASRWWIAAGAAVLAAGVAVGLPGRGARAHDPCADHAIGGAWDQGRAAKVDGAFERSGRPSAPAVRAHVHASLDDYAARWSAMHHEVCEAARARGGQDRIAALREACLFDRRRRLDALTARLSLGEPDVLDQAARAVADLPSIERCADVDALAKRTPPPDAAIAREVDAVRDALAGAQIARIAGRYKEALDAARALEPRAEATRYPAVIAEVSLTFGQAAYAEGDNKQGRAALERAYREGLAGGDDALAADAATALAYGVGFLDAQAEEGRRWARDADALLRRIGDDPLLRAALANAEGNVAQAAGAYDEARAAFKRAQRAFREVPGDHRIDLGGAIHNQGNALSLQGKNREALALLEQARALWIEALGADHPLIGMVEGNLSRTLGALDRNDEAITHAERAVAIARANAGPDHVSTAMALLSLGGALLAAERSSDALARLHEADAIFVKHSLRDHPAAVKTRSNIGLALVELGRFAEAEVALRDALERKVRLFGASHPTLTTTLDGLGRAALRRGDPGLALEHYRRSLAIGEAALGKGSLSNAWALVGIGEAHLARGEVKPAREALDRALSVRVAGGAPPSEIARVRALLAQVDARRRPR